MTKKKGKVPQNQDLERLLEGRHLAEPAEGTLRRAIALGSNLPRKEGLGEWIARLVFDSQATAPAAVRGVALDRRMLFEIGREGSAGFKLEVDLLLRIDAAGKLCLTGQLLPAGGPESVEVRSGRSHRTKRIDAAGGFVFRGLPRPATELEVEFSFDDGSCILLPGVPLPGAPDGQG